MFLFQVCCKRRHNLWAAVRAGGLFHTAVLLRQLQGEPVQENPECYSNGVNSPRAFSMYGLFFSTHQNFSVSVSEFENFIPITKIYFYKYAV